MNLGAIQSALSDAKLDGWLFYDHHHRDPIAYRVLKLDAPMCTRRWYYLIPAEGQPTKLVHRIERSNLEALPGTEHQYSSWREQREKLQEMLACKAKVAMQYSQLNDIPYIGLVDAGTVELVRSFGVEVVSSADLVQLFEARWSTEALALHLEAGKVVHAAVDTAFRTIRDAVQTREAIGEYEVQQEIVRFFETHGVESDDPPVVAVNENTANPHYSPTLQTSRLIREGDFVLLDVWAKRRAREAVYFDITWTGYVGEAVPDRYARIFEIVREARDVAIELVQQALRGGRPLRGYQVDEAVRDVITRHGYGEYFIHRTGHSIGEDVHGNGANIDNFETRDNRAIIPRTCFSIEPGIYLPEFGVRSEVDVYIEESDARVTGDIQKAIVPILAK
ncbi:MAG: M24 family metallopeptidase [Candidatus Eisenbacteria bacterium]|nr:M24 family metallopeptidase [Candidatus Eisenbacteria bacterium]